MLMCNEIVTTALKVEKKEGEKINYNQLKVKELKKLLG